MAPLSLSLLFAILAQAAVFGTDDRLSVGPFTPFRMQARATAVAVLRPLVSQEAPGKLRLETDPLSYLCPEEPFYQDPSVSFACTGFLIAPDLLVTAGHCSVNHGEVKNEEKGYCEVYDWLFGYHQEPGGQVALSDIPEKNRYRCKRIVYAVFEEQAPFRDFALIQLDRPVTDRKPFLLADSRLAKGDAVFMTGHPLGAPMKLAGNARVLKSDPNAQAFLTNLDAQDGNSGSPVFNSAGEVTGILVNGTPSSLFVEDKARGCSLFNRCDDKGENCLLPDPDPSRFPEFQGVGSGVQRIDAVKALLSSGL